MVTKVSSKGQITIPLEIRKRLGISDGSQLELKVIDGEIILELLKKQIDIADIKGILKTGKKASNQEINSARNKALQKKYKQK